MHNQLLTSWWVTLGVDFANQLEKERETVPFDYIPWVPPCLASTLLPLTTFLYTFYLLKTAGKQMLWRMCPRRRNCSLIPAVLWSLPLGHTALGYQCWNLDENSHPFTPIHPFITWMNEETYGQAQRWKDGPRDNPLRLCNPPPLSNKKNFSGKIFTSAKPDQMGPKK